MEQQTKRDTSADNLVSFEAIDLRQYAFVLLKRKWFILFFTLLVSVIAMTWTMGQERIYSASCAIVIEAQAPQVLGEIRDAVNIGSGGYWYNREYYETQYRIIRSREVAERVVEKLGLEGDIRFLGLEKLPEEKREAALKRADAASVLLGRITVEPVHDSMVVQILAEDRDPERAAMIANAVADTYMQLNVERRAEGSRDAADWLGDQRRDLKAKHEKSELALYEFRKANDLVYTSLEDKQTMTTQKFATISDSLTRTRLKRAELSPKVKKIQEAQRSGKTEQLMALDDVASSPFIIDLKKKYLDCQNEVLDLSERYGDEHPKMKVAKEKLETARNVLNREVMLLLNVRLTQFAELMETERALADMLGEVKREAFENNKKEIEYKRLAREEANNRNLSDLVVKRMTELDLSSLLKTNNVRRLEQASPPDRPIRPRPLKNLLVAAVLGLLLGMGIALGLDALDQSVRGPADLTAMELDCLGLLSKIPTGKNTDRDRFAADSPQSVLSEQMRAIRTNMLFMRPDAPPRCIVITSAFPQEGKTTTLINLGITLAQAGGRILLVDSDMRRPRLHKTFNLGDEKGLSSVIAGTDQLDDAVRKTDIENLFVLPCGPVPPNPAELLHTRRFQELIREMSGKFDRVLFDSPPAGIVTDAIILSNELDGTIFVIKAFKTEKPAVERALASLREAGAKMMGAILNNVSGGRRAGYYGDYYGGYYGGYYRYGSYGRSESSGRKHKSARRGTSGTSAKGQAAAAASDASGSVQAASEKQPPDKNGSPPPQAS